MLQDTAGKDYKLFISKTNIQPVIKLFFGYFYCMAKQ